MNHVKFLTLSCLVALLAAPVPSGCEEFLLYVPKPAAGDQAPASPEEGVLVKKVTVKRGDTLSRLSKQHLGEANWFPQMLLFNKIKNPDLIYAGDSILIPVPAGHEGSLKKSGKAVKGGKAVAKGKRRKGTKGAKGKRHHLARSSSHQPKFVVVPLNSESAPRGPGEQQGYQRAKKAYQAGQYQKAQELFAVFLKNFPTSNLAPDASLYQADCFLHLSGQ